MITSLRATNLKGLTFDHPRFGPINFITGPNMTGKTAHLQALQLALTGSTPGLGKQNKDIYALASGPFLSVGVRFDDGHEINRTWKPKGTSITSTTTGDLPPGFDVVQLDPSAFMKASPKDRAVMIRARFPSAEDPKQALWDMLNAVCGGRQKWTIPTAEDLSEWLEQATATLKELKSQQRAVKERMRDTIQGITQLQLSGTEQAEASHAEELQALLSGINQAVGALEGQMTSLHAEMARLRPLAASFDANMTGKRDEIAARIKEKSEERGGLIQRRQSITQRNQEIARRNQERSHLTQYLESHRKNTAEVLPAVMVPADLDGLNDAYNTARRKVDYLWTTNAQKEKAVRDAQAMGEAERCPCCGAARGDWNDEALIGFNDRLTDARTALDTHQKEIQAAETEMRRLKDALEAARSHETRRLVIDALHASREQSNAIAEQKEARFAELGPIDEVMEDDHALAEEIDDLGETILGLSEQEQALEQNARAATAATEMQRLAAEEQRLIGELEAKRAQREGIEGRLNTARAAVTALAQAAADKKRIDEATAAMAAAEQAETDFGAMVTTIQEQGANIAARALAPLIDQANAFLEGLMKTPLAAVGVNLGRWSEAGDRFIPFQTFSDSEQALVTAAVMAALSANSTSRILVIDEFNRVDKARKPIFLANLSKAIDAGTISQAFILDNVSKEEISFMPFNPHHRFLDTSEL